MSATRRKFIRDTATAAAAVSIANPLRTFANVSSTNKVNVGLIGVNGHGFNVLKYHYETGKINCAGLCDIDKNRLETRAAEVLKNYGQKPKIYSDFRKMLEDKDIDAIIVATPDHWHCLLAVYACQAGKDVYLEKPMANTIEECNIIVNAAKRYNRIVQIGQQQRSDPLWLKINRMIKEGRIGKLRKVNIWANFVYGIGGPKKPDQPVPEGVDFNFWLGPAPLRSFNPNRFHGYWRMFWDYGGGLLTDWGVHLIDMAFWAKDVISPPENILASGGNFSFKDHDHETFDTLSVIFGMDDYTITWENTSGTENGPWNKSYGLAFIGDLATILVNRTGYKLIPESTNPEAEESEMGVKEQCYLHADNFIECIKSRKTPNCPPETGRAVAIAVHSANIAVRSGAGLLLWDDKTNRFTNSEEANKYIVPEYRKPWELPLM